MQGMKFQFSTKTIFLVITAAGISFAGWLGWAGTFGLPMPIGIPVTAFLVGGPLWMPAVFLAFAFGRKALTPKMVIGFAVAEAITFGIKWLLLTYQPFLQ
jgi:hypothetical protein